MHVFDTALKIRTAVDIFGEVGAKRFIREIVPWVFLRRFFFYSQSLKGPFPFPSCQLPFRLELVKEKDLHFLLDVRPGFYHLSSLQKRLEEGHLCFLGWSGQNPVHIRWVFVNSLYLPYLRQKFVLRPGEVFVDEAYTRPEYRRHGVYSYAGYLMRPILQNLGYGRLICAFASWNVSSQKGSEKLGMKKVGEGGYRNIFGIKKFYWEGSVQYCGDGKISIKKEE
jgi:hypothetical protein